ncbi:MAG: hypothetical protein A2V85_03950 [Chloroflexi bacterium RBG_16_72_14]|nr:MAG: hypothetical protein A2V85_03950 [Chloroflexi bacterium RBG_16_72_14]
MAVDAATPRSRRALLAAGAGAIAATAIEALGHPAPVRAEGETMVVGGEYATATSRTRLVNVTNGEDVFRAESSSGVAVYGVSANHVGVRGDSNNFIGVRGVALSGTGVRGDCDGGIGVLGDASGGSGSGVEGHSGNGMGVYGQSQNGQAVRGTSLAADLPAVIGLSVNSNTGVAGWSGSSTDPTTPAKTGVYGIANQDTSAVGVKGESTVGTGVVGVTDGDLTSGVFGGANATSGTANGVFGASNADGGNGVRGWATSPTGTTSGV